ncbi:MAG: TrkH family potassium uptake protein [Pseudomonadota bacterium]|nr:TrkH family potassium uptake protein [Pseudomonadota bacterium]MEC8168772.1 TrkH family potassium uptake protein [Pseudomonadota bacterium]
MKYRLISKILGTGLILFSAIQSFPIIISLIYNEQNYLSFLESSLITFASGLFLYGVNYSKDYEDLKIRDGFLLIVLLWFIFSIFASIPFILKTNPLTIVNAYFEAVSGLTTTGATIFVNLENELKSILFYRALLQWVGGLGIVVLALALFPILGIGGMQLYRGEASNPVNNNKLRPKMAETAKSLWFIYLFLTILCFFCYRFSGMTNFDAVTHAFTTIAIGGFSNYDNSFAYFSNNLIYLFASVFMFLSAISFSLHFVAFNKIDITGYFKDKELKFYATIIFVSFILIFIVLQSTNANGNFDTLILSVFQTISFATTTGFVSTDQSSLPLFIPYLLIALAGMGACAGSTGGGLKAIRVYILFRQAKNELKKLIHPSSVIPLKIGDNVIDKEISDSVWGFVSVYLFALFFGILLILATGINIETAFSTIFSCLNNLGPALGDATENYASLNDASKIILSFTMILGRLEIYTLLVLFTTFFWRS